MLNNIKIFIIPLIFLFSCSRDIPSLGGSDDMDNFIKGKVQSLDVEIINLDKIIKQNNDIIISEHKTSKINTIDSTFEFHNIESGTYIISAEKNKKGLIYNFNFYSGKKLIQPLKIDSQKTYTIKIKPNTKIFIPLIKDTTKINDSTMQIKSYPGKIGIYEITKENLTITQNINLDSSLYNVANKKNIYKENDTIAFIFSNNSTPVYLENQFIPIKINIHLDSIAIYSYNKDNLDFYIESSSDSSTTLWMKLPIFEGGTKHIATIIKNRNGLNHDQIFQNSIFSEYYNFSKFQTLDDKKHIVELANNITTYSNGNYKLSDGINGSALDLSNNNYLYNKSKIISDSISVSVWAKTSDSLKQKQTIYSHYQEYKNKNFELYIDNNKYINILLPKDSTHYQIIRSLDSLKNIDKWHNYVFTYNSQICKIYLDGIEIPSIKITLESKFQSVTTDNEYIGTDNTCSYENSFSGLIDQLKVSYKIFSTEFIKASYENESPNTKYIEPVLKLAF